MSTASFVQRGILDRCARWKEVMRKQRKNETKKMPLVTVEWQSGKLESRSNAESSPDRGEIERWMDTVSVFKTALRMLADLLGNAIGQTGHGIQRGLRGA